MRVFHRQLGFTLIELLVAVGILAVLAGVAVPVVARFVGESADTGAAAELQNVQSAVDAMMTANHLVTLSDPGPGASGALRSDAGSATSDMSVFPYTLAGDYAICNGPSGNYLRADTAGTYYIDGDGTVHQASTGH